MISEERPAWVGIPASTRPLQALQTHTIFNAAMLGILQSELLDPNMSVVQYS